jgi:hypothetical protein
MGMECSTFWRDDKFMQNFTRKMWGATEKKNIS